MHLDHPRRSIIQPPDSLRLKAGAVRLGSKENVGEHSTKDFEELLVIISGVATVTVDEQKQTVRAGETLYIPPHAIHNVQNDSDEPLQYVYVTA